MMISYLVFCRTTTVFIAVVVFSLYSLSSFAADLEVGKAKAQVCIACHGPDGNSINPEFPSLSGQPAQAISTALFRFREGNRKNTVMSPFAANLSNRDMNDIAANAEKYLGYQIKSKDLSFNYLGEDSLTT
jgi:cytochrome c553